MGRDEAVKEIRLTDTGRFEDAMKEAKRLVELGHRNIVDIYDADYLSENKGIYISMEYLENGSVDNFGFISIFRLKQICLDVLSALEHAHSRNYIHRDIKPSNILIAKDGTSKLSDFGIATQLDALGTTTPRGYMKHLAPEFFRDERYSVSSDIYAMGVTMHRMINEDPSHLNGMGDSQLKHAIINGEYPSREEYRPDVPTKLMRLINRALATNPENRFSSASEMAIELRGVKVKCEWTRNERETCVEWDGKTDGKKISVLCSRENREIITKQKRKGAKSLRRINRLCYQNLTPREADYRLSIVLRGFESGRYF